MVLPRKKPAKILKRDHAFTQAIGKPATGKPNPYALAEAGRQARTTGKQSEKDDPEKLVTSRSSAAPDELIATKGPNHKVAGRTDTREATPQEATHEQPNKDSITTEAEQEAGRAGEDAPSVELSISVFVPGALVERAEKWAASIHQPMKAVIRHSFAKMKPDLLAELKTITAADVHQHRGEKIGYRLQSRTRFTQEELADLEARLDPAGLGNVNSMLNFYARSRLVTFLDKRMADAGY